MRIFFNVLKKIDTESPEQYLERVLSFSWQSLLRDHQADRDLESILKAISQQERDILDMLYYFDQDVISKIPLKNGESMNFVSDFWKQNIRPLIPR